MTQFHFETEYRRATSMQHVDMISRIPESQPEADLVSGGAVGTESVGQPVAPGSAAVGSRAPVGGRPIGVGESVVTWSLL